MVPSRIAASITAARTLNRFLLLRSPATFNVNLRHSSSYAGPRREFPDSRLSQTLRPPETLKSRPPHRNSASFIGKVTMPVTRTYYGAYTVLEVKNSLESDRTFRVLLSLEDEWAELCLEHLKPDDFIFVTGCLGSSEKKYRYGELRVLYKVNVKELNFIMPNYPGHKDERSQAETNVKQNSLSDRKPVSEGDRLRLWQVFLANPHEWWDNRKIKKHPRAPDFKHKDTGEVLWINPDDPPWLKRQLELLDSHMEGRDQGVARARLSTWKFDDLGGGTLIVDTT